MKNAFWCIVDTETTGFRAPIFVVEIAAQRMRGWAPEGPPFRRLLNHGTDVPPDAARVHGYTREILERDGDDPREVYRDLSGYARDLPISAYNLSYDWDDVLVPEWARLSLGAVGSRGICLLNLAQRLLDPVPAGNCKLQTLRQYYALPARGAHTALGDVETVVDLLQRVLRPLCEARGLHCFDEIARFSQAPWFPTRIPFGKFRGRNFHDARHDAGLRSWLEWLAASSNARSRAMGGWYLERLDAGTEGPAVAAVTGTTLTVYINPDLVELKRLIEDARDRLAELEAEYTALRQAASVTEARLFDALRDAYQRRDVLRVRLEQRRKYLETLLRDGEDEAKHHEEERIEAEESIDAEYERTANEAAGKRSLSEEETRELTQLWRRLVRVFHPDRYAADHAKQVAYERLTQEINLARDAGNIDRLREIAADPEGYIARKGWGEISIREVEDIDELRSLYESLQAQILSILDAIEVFRDSPANELHRTLGEQPELFGVTVKQYRESLSHEIQELEDALAEVERELAALIG